MINQNENKDSAALLE